jgi:hypothetical protein
MQNSPVLMQLSAIKQACLLKVWDLQNIYAATDERIIAHADWGFSVQIYGAELSFPVTRLIQ